MDDSIELDEFNPRNSVGTPGISGSPLPEKEKTFAQRILRRVRKSPSFQVPQGKGLPRGGAPSKYKKWYTESAAFLNWVTDSANFRVTILCIVAINLIFVAAESSPEVYRKYGAAFDILDIGFIVIYAFEFVMKLYASPKEYWKGSYNRLDFSILVVSFLQLARWELFAYSNVSYSFLRALRAVRSLRALRFISLNRGTQVITTALMKTFKTLWYVMMLLLVPMFVGSIIGYQLFGNAEVPEDLEGDFNFFVSAWETMLTLFVFVTADSWTDVQDMIDQVFGTYSRFYSFVFLFLGHFMFENLLASLMIQYLTEAEKEEKQVRKRKKIEAITKKKAFIMEHQQQDVAFFLEKQLQLMKDQPQASFHEILKQFEGKISLNNEVYSSDIATSLPWMELYMATLQHQEHTMYRQQQLHFEIAKTLGEVLERRLQTKVEPSLI